MEQTAGSKFKMISEEKRAVRPAERLKNNDACAQHYAKNRERLLAHQAEYRQTDAYKENRRKWLEKNRQYFLEYKRKVQNPRYYAKRLERVTCKDCGRVYTKGHQSEHWRSKKHLAALQPNGNASTTTAPTVT